MNRPWFASILLVLMFPATAAEIAPSALMRQLPSIPAVPQAESCAATEPLLAQMEQHGRADMMRTHQVSVSAMSAGGAAITDRQGALIQRLMDPSVTMCDMHVSTSVAGVDAANDFRKEQSAIRQKAHQRMVTECPVIGMADYRDPACVGPIEKRSHQEEHAALARFVTTANTQLRKEVDGYAQCAEARERLADEAEAAKLPAQFLSVALGNRAGGWQTVATLAERFGNLCNTAVSAGDELRIREDAH